jgi:hypothetical protein
VDCIVLLEGVVELDDVGMAAFGMDLDFSFDSFLLVGRRDVGVRDLMETMAGGVPI